MHSTRGETSLIKRNRKRADKGILKSNEISPQNLKTLKFAGFGLLFFIIIILLSYMINFGVGMKNISDDPEHWASFGSYFGGLLGPIFGGVNLLFLIYINNMLMKQNHIFHKSAKKQSEKEFNERIAFEKKEEITKNIFLIKNLIMKNITNGGNVITLRWSLEDIERFKMGIEYFFVYVYSYFNNIDFVYMRAFICLLDETFNTDDYNSKELKIQKDQFNTIIKTLTKLPVRMSTYLITNEIDIKTETALETSVNQEMENIDYFNDLEWTEIPKHPPTRIM
jgi:hypothetical protein